MNLQGKDFDERSGSTMLTTMSLPNGRVALALLKGPGSRNPEEPYSFLKLRTNRILPQSLH